MTISVSHNTDALALAAQLPAPRKSIVEQPSQQDSTRTQPEQSLQTKEQVVNSRSLSLDVNSPDYRIKVMVEREMGERTEQTVLNFYKRSNDADSQQGKLTDTLV